MIEIASIVSEKLCRYQISEGKSEKSETYYSKINI